MVLTPISYAHLQGDHHTNMLAVLHTPQQLAAIALLDAAAGRAYCTLSISNALQTVCELKRVSTVCMLQLFMTRNGMSPQLIHVNMCLVTAYVSVLCTLICYVTSTLRKKAQTVHSTS
jgi:hypothetical protein